jgi:outer membrane lipoprotein carrier protein
VDTHTAQVLKQTMVELDGSENTISFLNLKANVGVEADSFTLNPPDGTYINDLTKQKK